MLRRIVHKRVSAEKYLQSQCFNSPFKFPIIFLCGFQDIHVQFFSQNEYGTVLFWKFQFWPFVSPKPLQVYTHTILRLKALINGIMDLEGLRFGSTLTLRHAFKPYSILHNKLAKGNCIPLWIHNFNADATCVRGWMKRGFYANDIHQHRRSLMDCL